MNCGRRRSASVSVTLAATVALALAGCSSGPDHQGVCVDDQNGRRVEDSRCDTRGGGGGHWYYYGRGSTVPAVGAPAHGGTTVTPGGSVARGGAPAAGGKVTRGGFGGHGSGHGSVGG